MVSVLVGSVLAPDGGGRAPRYVVQRDQRGTSYDTRDHQALDHYVPITADDTTDGNTHGQGQREDTEEHGGDTKCSVVDVPGSATGVEFVRTEVVRSHVY